MKEQQAKKNLYQKLAEARVMLQDMNLQMTGKNTFSGYKYYNLPDFLPAVNAICNKIGLLTQFKIAKNKEETAVLTVYNSEEPSEKLDFIAPTAEVQIGKKRDGSGGAEPIQNLGGKITYMRRYLLIAAFEIIESDIVETINREIVDKVDEADLQKIEAAKSINELSVLYKELNTKYKARLITPLFTAKKEKLKQDENI